MITPAGMLALPSAPSKPAPKPRVAKRAAAVPPPSAVSLIWAAFTGPCGDARSLATQAALANPDLIVSPVRAASPEPDLRALNRQPTLLQAIVLDYGAPVPCQGVGASTTLVVSGGHVTRAT